MWLWLLHSTGRLVKADRWYSKEGNLLKLQRVAILSPGDMGHAVGRDFRASGLEVLTCLSGRSSRTRELAEHAGFKDVPSLKALTKEADLVLSIIVPDAAVVLAEEVAKSLKSTGCCPVYVDCNAVSPATSRRIGSIISEAGGSFLDASIIGPPPGKGQAPRFYVSGTNADIMGQLDGRGVAVKWIGNDIGRASAIKMCYAGLTKGTLALHTAVLASAEALGLSAELRSELGYSQDQTLKAMEQVRRVPAKAFRWIAEMEEIARTFGSVGVTPGIHSGAADVFSMVAESELGSERTHTLNRDRTLSQTVSLLTSGLKRRH